MIKEKIFEKFWKKLKKVEKKLKRNVVSWAEIKFPVKFQGSVGP